MRSAFTDLAQRRFATPVLAQMDAISMSDGLPSRRCRGCKPRRSTQVNGYLMSFRPGKHFEAVPDAITYEKL
jgi:hypothetical protein